ncbi:helix-turn-helix domain-containing protein [Sphingomonas morindae]|uniref:Helix-turn-helix domain-containing protein n=1 Tax=Sphingomonas morindae TaxID=1541170 RepID=A0ABY4X989_9SPHN|nr:helix-turn-helix domain-containing protein [Sphingomonas morindae]USI73266.1 helix-turn-helix domain-containing protein [Sphingomonas morindae]
MSGPLDLAERLMLVGDRQQILDLAFGVARSHAASVSVQNGEELLRAVAAQGGPMLMIELPKVLPAGEAPAVPAASAAPAGAQAAAAAVAPGVVPAVAPLVGQALAQVERAMILGTLAHCHGNRTYAAQMLGISVRTMRNKLRALLDEGVAVPPAPAAHGAAGTRPEFG